MSKYLNKALLLKALKEEMPTTKSSFYDGWRKAINELIDEIDDGRFDVKEHPKVRFEMAADGSLKQIKEKDAE